MSMRSPFLLRMARVEHLYLKLNNFCYSKCPMYKGLSSPWLMTDWQRKRSSSGLTIVFSKLVIMAGNCGCILRMLFENCNPLIYCAAMITI